MTLEFGNMCYVLQWMLCFHSFRSLLSRRESRAHRLQEFGKHMTGSVKTFEEREWTEMKAMETLGPLESYSSSAESLWPLL